MEADDSDSASVEYNFETQPDSVGFMVLTSQSESQPRNTEDADIMQIWPALQQGEERKEKEKKSLVNCLASVMDTSGDEQKPAEAAQILATETELSESEMETEVTVIEKTGKSDHSTPEPEEKQTPKTTGRSPLTADFRSLSPQDMFENDDEEVAVCTSAGFVGSLHLSNQAMLVPETTESEDPLPSTPEEFEGLPKIIPSSPTDGSFQDGKTDDPTHYNPKDDSTLADEATVVKKSRKSDEPESSQCKSLSSTGDKKDLGENRTQSESVQYNPQKERTLVESSDDQQSLHLHYSETQKSSLSRRQEDTADSVEVVGTSFMDVISIKSSDGTEIDPVPESQELSLRLTPSQSDKSSKGTDTETVVTQPIRRRVPMVRSQDLVTERQVLRHDKKTDKIMSQPARPDRNQEVDVDRLRGEAVEARGKGPGLVMASESEMFALSLPKDGELLHPKVSSGKSSKPEVDSQSSVVKVSQGTPGKKSGRTKVSGSPTRSGRQEGNNGQEGGDTVLSEPGPSHQAAKDNQGLENTPPLVESQVSTRCFLLQPPHIENIAMKEMEDTQQNVFKRTMSEIASPRKRVIQEDSDDEVTIHVHKRQKKSRSSQLGSSDEDASQKKNSPSRHPGTPKTTTMEQSLQNSEKGSTRGTPIRKIPSISSEGSQSKVSLQKKTSISTEGGYQASIEDEHSISNINDQETALAGQGSRPLIAIPVWSQEQVTVNPLPDLEPDTSMVKDVPKRRTKKSTPIVQTPVSGKKRKCLTKLRTGSRIKKCASPRDTQPRTPSLTAAPTVVVTTTSSTSSEESAHINVLGQGLLAQRSTIILSPPLARASSLESVLSRQPRMSTSETPTNRPSKVRASKTEPRFKIPVRTELDRSPSLEQQLSTTEDVERKTVIIKVKQFEVRTEITEMIRQGKVVSRSEKEVAKEPVTVKVKTYQEMEALSPGTFSSSSTGSSLASGYLGDISSGLSRSGSSNVPSLSEHEIPLTQPSSISLEVSSVEVSEVLSPVVEAVEGATVQGCSSATPAAVSVSASVRSESITPNVSKGFAVIPTSAFLTDVPSTSAGVGHEHSLHSRKKQVSSEEVSSEVPYQDELNITATTESIGVGLLRSRPVKDSRVMAKWKDGYYYPGIIQKVEGSRYQVKFDDGDSRYVRHSEALLIERLPLGQPVMVQSQDGYFDAGLIVGQVKKGGVFQYSVEKDSGETRTFSNSDVILSEEQANLLLTDLPTSPQKAVPLIEPNPANVSLDNLVEGKRRAGNTTTHGDETAPKKPSTSKGASCVEGEEAPQSSTRGKRRIHPLPQQATSTPTRKEKGRGASRVADPESTPIYPDVAVSPIEPRRSPRKARHGLFGKEKQPFNATPFSGLVFLLTYVEKSKDLKEEEKTILKNPDLTSDDSSVEQADDDEVPFDKQDIITKIQAGGGVVLDKFDEAAIANAKQCFLISNSYQRTIKYFQCLAAAIPCISHLWIRDSSNEGVLLDYKAYKLQAGVSLEKRKKMEWSNRKGDLLGLSVFVSSSHKKFQEEWSFILKLAGCQVLHKLPTVNSDTRLDVIVTDLTCPKTVLHRSRKSGIPLVASEWVMQCLINGRRLNYRGHPRYNYDFHS
ncbi:TP53-binding protein 1-like isoform X3 [Crassostrea angulata]|uniref:TP53-binding protein 1-like isoform X3 n=1 Tax=Magallana angulata TaxID=2784310 RepID=UPI0022B0E61A|nr:TP53-binding protein 1-like isoform X3 [Crassostrea angulata]